MSTKFKEYDVVTNTVAIDGIPARTVGTIVHVYDEQKQVFEVEFFDSADESLDTRTVHGDHLKLKVKRWFQEFGQCVKLHFD